MTTLTSELGTGLDDAARTEPALRTLRRGLRLTPEFRAGLAGTFALALAATAGRIVVPVAVQQTIDRGLTVPGGPDLGFVRSAMLLCALVVLATAACAYAMNVRLYRSTGMSTTCPCSPRAVNGAAPWSPG